MPDHLLPPANPATDILDIRTIFEAVSEGIVVQDASGAIVSCNDAAEAVLGLTRDQLMGRTSTDPRWRAVHEDGSDFPGAEHPAMAVLNDGIPRRDVVMGIHKPNGQLTWISINATRIGSAQQPHVVSVFRDITDRLTTRQLLSAISEAQATFIAGDPKAVTFTRMLDAVLRLTNSEYGFIGEVLRREDGTPYLKSYALTDVSWSAESKAFYDRHVASGIEFTDLSTLFGRTVETGEVVIANDPSSDPRRGGLPHGHPPLTAFLGLPIMVDTQLVGMVGLANRPGGYSEELADRLIPYLTTCGSMIDAIRRERERQAAARAHLENEARLRLLLETTGLGQWDWNPATNVAMFDARWAGLLGYEVSELRQTGEQWLALMHPDDQAHVAEVLEAHLKGRISTYRAQFRMRHKDGHWVWTLALGRVVARDADGAPTRMLGVHLDVTSQKDVEAALERARDEAERASRAKTDFLANMSHEIRTPMNGVIGMAHLLLATPLTPEQRQYTETMMRSGEILLGLIDDVLDFSKIEAERLVLEQIAFDPRQALVDVVSVVAPRAEAKGLEVVVDWVCEPVARMTGDPKRIRQVLLNFGSNAVKFSDRGAVVMRVERVDEGHLRFSVTDHGIGIPADKQAAVFDKFVQADSTTTRRFGGSGLGLAISKRLVEAMGGAIGVQSEVGVGSTFWFTLPTGADAEVETPTEALRGARVQLISDNSDLAGAVQRTLARSGASVTLGEGQAEPETVVLVDYGHSPLALDTTLRVLGSRNDDGRSAAVMISATLKGAIQAMLPVDVNIITKPTSGEALVRHVEAIAAKRRIGTAQVVSPDLQVVVDAGPALKVLLAEDNEVNRLVATKMLLRQKCEVEIAHDGREAVQKALETRYDVILMDCDMPELDGFEATAAIRAFASDSAGCPPDVPIVALTANALAGDRERCLAAGMTGYLPKPVVPKALAATLAQLARRGPAGQADNTGGCAA